MGGCLMPQERLNKFKIDNMGISFGTITHEETNSRETCKNIQKLNKKYRKQILRKRGSLISKESINLSRRSSMVSVFPLQRLQQIKQIND